MSLVVWKKKKKLTLTDGRPRRRSDHTARTEVNRWGNGGGRTVEDVWQCEIAAGPGAGAQHVRRPRSSMKSRTEAEHVDITGNEDTEAVSAASFVPGHRWRCEREQSKGSRAAGDRD